MNWPYLHLIVNHFPIILLAVGGAAALIGHLLRREAALRYGAVCLVLAGLSVPLAYVTGLQAEEAVEPLWYAAEAAIEAHEELGLWALIGGVAAGGAALAWLLRGGKPLARLVVVLGLAGAALIVATALRGGQIVHASPALETGPDGGVPAGVSSPEDREES